jgi:AcrR family transcriptional regulator
MPPSTRDTRVFPQARARATYDALLAAARDVFMEKGFDAAQTPEIADRAGVSVGTFYRYFADKRQAFIELIGAHLANAHQKILGNLSPSSFSESRTSEERRAALDEVIDVLFRHAAEYPKLHRVFLGMSLRDPDVAKLRVDFEEL